ncbi:hypothetical protein CZ771_08360 [Actinomycetales bacterium JB111]|nr:hypothetical protein CZ771_08360 [Actinomycetales bacterium JB111]
MVAAPGTARHGRRLLRTVGRVVLVLVAVVVGALLVRFGLQAVREWRAPGAIRDSLGAAVEEERAAFASDRDTARPEILDQFTARLDEPVTSALGYTCELRSIDQGWIVADWQQTCEWWTIDYYVVTDAGVDPVLPEDARRYGAPCSPVSLDSAHGREDEMAIDVVEVSPGQTDDDGEPCALPRPGEANSSRERGVTLEPADETAIGLADLGPEDRVVAVSYSREFYAEQLDCGIGLLFCNSPVDGPVVLEP